MLDLRRIPALTQAEPLKALVKRLKSIHAATVGCLGIEVR